MEEIKIKKQTEGIRLVLDGQQRITAIFRALEGVDEIWFRSKNEEELEIDNKPYNSFNLEELASSNSESFGGREVADRLCLKISDIWKMYKDNDDDDEVKEKYFNKTLFYKAYLQNAESEVIRSYFKKYNYLKKKLIELLQQQKLISYYLLDMSLDKFITFFERSNTKGVQLNFIDILTAKLYTGNFKLRQEITTFENQNSNYLFSPELVVRTIAYFESAGKDIERNYILTKLEAKHFIAWWEKICRYYIVAVDFLIKNNLIINQSWMPYENMLIPTMIFLHEIGGDFHKMKQNQKEFFVLWYLNAVFSLRYSGSSNERIIEDSRILTEIAKKEKISDAAFFNKITKNQITNSDELYDYDKKGNAIYKGIFNLINYDQGGLLDWHNDSKLSFNSELEDHHIFPKGYVGRNNFSESEKDKVDCVLNRTLLPKKLNISVRDARPKLYLKEFESKNPNLRKTLDNHILPQELVDGNYDESFSQFLEWRAKAVFNVIERHIIQKATSFKDAYYFDANTDQSTLVIFGVYKKQEIQASYNKKSGTILYNDKIYDTPSAAAQQAKIDKGAGKDNTENGWSFWKYLDDNGDKRSISDFRPKKKS